jgi:hypothetical protein
MGREEADVDQELAEEESAALTRSLRRGVERPEDLIRDVIRSIERDYTPAFAARTVPSLRRALKLMDNRRGERGERHG